MRLSSYRSILLTALFTYCGVAVITLGLLHFLPGNPFSELERLADFSASFNDRLHPHSIGAWCQQLWRALCFDFGPSWRYPTHSAIQLLLNSWGYSLTVGLGALMLGWFLGGVLALRSALRTTLSNAERLGCTIALSMPGFLLAGLALLLGLTSPRGMLPLQMLIAIACLAPLPAAHLFLQLRPLLLREWAQPYCRAALLRGVSARQILVRHALRPAAAQLATGFVPLAASLLTGTAAVEQLLSIPGMGHWFVESVLHRDAPMVQAVTMFFTMILLAVSLLGQWASHRLDPRGSLEASP